MIRPRVYRNFYVLHFYAGFRVRRSRKDVGFTQEDQEISVQNIFDANQTSHFIFIVPV